MRFTASRHQAEDEDYEDEPLDILPGTIQVGDEYEVPCLLDHRGDPIEPTPKPIGFGR